MTSQHLGMPDEVVSAERTTKKGSAASSWTSLVPAHTKYKTLILLCSSLSAKGPNRSTVSSHFHARVLSTHQLTPPVTDGKVYSGLYEHEGHVVPYLVVAKVGKPSERSKPGNRGKRDSQVLLMRFLNRVHEDLEMAPLELEIYHQIKNIIGVVSLQSLTSNLLCC